jgi:hypothetical protein
MHESMRGRPTEVVGPVHEQRTALGARIDHVLDTDWARPFVAEIRNNGGEVIASACIPAAVVLAVLDTLEPTAG